MNSLLTITSKILFTISITLLPVLGVAFFFGIVGFAPQFLVLTAIGYIGIMLFSFFAIQDPQYFPLIFACSIFIVFGIGLNEQYWNGRTDRLCNQLRRNPACSENVCAFYCTNLVGDGKTYPGSVCRDKDLHSCQNTVK